MCPALQTRVLHGACPCVKGRPRPAMTRWLGHLSTAAGRNGQGRMQPADLLPSSWRGSPSCSHLCADHWAGTNAFPACRSLPELQEAAFPALPSPSSGRMPAQGRSCRSWLLPSPDGWGERPGPEAKPRPSPGPFWSSTPSPSCKKIDTGTEGTSLNRTGSAKRPELGSADTW